MTKLGVTVVALLLCGASSVSAQVVDQKEQGVYSTYGNLTYGPGGTQFQHGNQVYTRQGVYSAYGNQSYGPSGTFTNSGKTMSYGSTGAIVNSRGNQTYIYQPDGKSIVCSKYGNNQSYCR